MVTPRCVRGSHDRGGDFIIPPHPRGYFVTLRSTTQTTAPGVVAVDFKLDYSIFLVEY